VIHLDAGTVEVLRSRRKVQIKERLAWDSAYRDTGYVFAAEDGQPYHPEYLSRAFTRMARRAGLSVTKLHGMRHFRAGALISTGADIAAVSKAMGHSSISVTSDIYGSLFEKAAKDMADEAAAWYRAAAWPSETGQQT
jgi:integrase